MEQSGRKCLRIISGTPLNLNPMLENKTMYTSNWNRINMETNIEVTSLYVYTMCCIFTSIQKIPKLGQHIFPPQGSPRETHDVPQGRYQ